MSTAHKHLTPTLTTDDSFMRGLLYWKQATNQQCATSDAGSRQCWEVQSCQVGGAVLCMVWNGRFSWCSPGQQVGDTVGVGSAEVDAPGCAISRVVDLWMCSVLMCAECHAVFE